VIKDALLPSGAALSGMRGCSSLAPDTVHNEKGPQASYPAHPLVLGEGRNSTVEQGGDTKANWSGMGHWAAEGMVNVPRAVGRVPTYTV
jgi:hypothetical protein